MYFIILPFRMGTVLALMQDKKSAYRKALMQVLNVAHSYCISLQVFVAKSSMFQVVDLKS